MHTLDAYFLTENQIQELDSWFRNHPDQLPEIFSSLTLRDVKLLIRRSRYYRLVMWIIYHDPTEVIFGRGWVRVMPKCCSMLGWRRGGRKKLDPEYKGQRTSRPGVWEDIAPLSI